MGRNGANSAARSARPWTSWVGRNWARVTYGRHVEPTWLELTRHQVPIAQLPKAFEGFRIVHLSDLHAGHRVPPTYLHEAVQLANAQAADLVALTGDFIHKGYRHVESVADTLAQLTAPAGVFAVLGNHDFSVRNALGIRRHRGLHTAVEQALKTRGIKVLRNEHTCIQRAGEGLHLVGLDDLWSRRCDVELALLNLSPRLPRVVLAHNPRTIEKLESHRCDLMLSGHTHGGQINWPGVGRVFLSRKGREFAAGMYQVRQSYLYVHRGVGFGLRFRFGVRPEIAVLELRCG
jgi:predicted MPP superfamily phosphohydrolase